MRVEFPGAIYHVMNRGDRHEPIFRDDLDHKKFLAALAEACTKTDWQVHAFCLMGNHFRDSCDVEMGCRGVEHGNVDIANRLQNGKGKTEPGNQHELNLV